MEIVNDMLIIALKIVITRSGNHTTLLPVPNNAYGTHASLLQ